MTDGGPLVSVAIRLCRALLRVFLFCGRPPITSKWIAIGKLVPVGLCPAELLYDNSQIGLSLCRAVDYLSVGAACNFSEDCYNLWNLFPDTVVCFSLHVSVGLSSLSRCGCLVVFAWEVQSIV
jgi:hypothetical protein